MTNGFQVHPIISKWLRLHQQTQSQNVGERNTKKKTKIENVVIVEIWPTVSFDSAHTYKKKKNRDYWKMNENSIQPKIVSH